MADYRNVTFVDPSTGEVLGTGYRYGNAEAVVVDGTANPSETWYSNGSLTAYTEAQKADKAVVPKHPARWDNTLMAWVDTRTLEEVKIDCWEEVKVAREAAFAVPLATPYGVFDADPVSRQNIADSVALSDKLKERGMPSDIEFTLYDNTRVVLTNSQMGDVGLMLGSQVNAAYSKADSMRQSIDAATTREDALAAAVW